MNKNKILYFYLLLLAVSNISYGGNSASENEFSIQDKTNEQTNRNLNLLETQKTTLNQPDFKSSSVPENDVLKADSKACKIPKDYKPQYVITINKIVLYPRATRDEKEICTIDGQKIWIHSEPCIHSNAIKEAEIIPSTLKPSLLDLKLKTDLKSEPDWLQNNSSLQFAFMIDGVCFIILQPDKIRYHQDNSLYLVTEFSDNKKIILEEIMHFAPKNYIFFNKKTYQMQTQNLFDLAEKKTTNPDTSNLTSKNKGNSDKSIEDLIRHFNASGINVVETKQTVFKAMNAADGSLLKIDNGTIEIYKYDRSVLEQKAKLQRIEKYGNVQILERTFKARVNDTFIMINWENHPRSDEIAYVFDSF